MPQARLLKLAAAIADGEPIDWTEVDGMPDLPPGLARHAQAVERIAQLHASLPPAETFSSSLAGASDAAFNGHGEDVPAAWGSLTIVEKIGHGTFGDVYRARDPRLDRPVALKLLRQRDERETAVIEEGRLLARVRHPNVVTIHGAERIDGRVGLWMEFIDGPTLEQELKARGPFRPDAVIEVALSMTSALAAVHAAGLLHRDVKAQNVMRDVGGRLVLTDFGAGRELMPARDGTSWELAGTPFYAAPEVLDGRPASPASDLYSLGVLLYHLASGAFPVRGRTIDDLRDAHARGARVPIRAASPNLPDSLATLIERLLERDPVRRIQSAAELRRLLDESVRDRAARSWSTVAAMVGVTLLVAAGAWMVSRRWDARAAPGGSRTPAAADPGGAGSPATVTFAQVSSDFQSRVNIRMPSSDPRLVTCTPWGHGSVAICDLASGSVREIRLPSSRDERSPSALLAPDLQRVAYVWTRGEDVSIRIINADGSNDRELVRAERGHDLGPLQWLRQPDALIAVDIDRSGSKRLMSIPPDGGSPVELHSFEHGANESYYQLSADARYLVFDRLSHSNRDVILLDMTTGRESTLVGGPSDDYGPRWTPSGGSIVFASDRFGSRALLAQAVRDGRADGEPVLVRDMGRSTITPMGFSGDGTLFLRLTVNWLDVFRAPMDLSAAAIEPARRVDPRSIDENVSPNWSPNGSRFAFLSGAIGYTIGTARVEIHRRDGAVDRVLPLPAGLPRSARVRWLPDGTRLLLSSFVRRDAGEGTSAVDLLDLADGRTTRLLTAPFIWEVKWDPVGSGFYYGSGQSIRRFDMVTGESRVVHASRPDVRIDTALTNFDVSPDGRSIAFIGPSPSGHAVRVLTIATGSVTDRYAFRGECRAVAWSRDGTRLLVSASQEPTRRPSLFVMDAASGEPTPLGMQTEYIVDFSVRPDDRELLVATGNPTPDVWTVSRLAGKSP